MKNHYLLLIFIFILAIQGISIAQKPGVTSNSTFVNYTSVDSCANVKYIFSVINGVLNGNATDFVTISQFEDAFIINSKCEDGCYFPNGNDEVLVLYEFTKALKKLALTDTNAIRILSILYRYNQRNAEYTEYFYSVFPAIAIANTQGFVLALHAMDDYSRKITIGNLEAISTKEDLNKLIVKLTTIDNTELSVTVSQLKEFLSEEFLVQFE